MLIFRYVHSFVRFTSITFGRTLWSLLEISGIVQDRFGIVDKRMYQTWICYMKHTNLCIKVNQTGLVTRVTCFWWPDNWCWWWVTTLSFPPCTANSKRHLKRTLQLIVRLICTMSSKERILRYWERRCLLMATRVVYRFFRTITFTT